MPIDLHQRLSEFSFGYGVTRHIERLLNDIGLETTPFLPSLIHEAELDSRLRALQSRARRTDDAIFAALGIDAWAAGAQLVAVTS